MTKTDFITKKIEDLAKGEVWSINPKARKLVLANIDPSTDTIESTDAESGKTIVLPYSDHKESVVFCHGPESNTEHGWNPELWQRVRLNGGEENCNGTIVDMDNAEPTDLNIIVLWDAPVNQRWMTEHKVNDLGLLQEKCSEVLVMRAKEARSLIKDLQNEHKRGCEADAHDAVKEDLVKSMAKREDYRKADEQRIAKRVQAVAKHVMDSYASDFKMMIEAGVLGLTAGADEGQIDRIPEMVDSHLDSIKIKVDAATTDEDLKIPATVAITQIMAGTMLNQYFLTRNAFIRAKDNKWRIFSDKNEKLGVHGNKKSAIRQLRLIEHQHRYGLD